MIRHDKGITAGAILPHGSTIPELAGDQEQLMAGLHRACLLAGAAISQCQPECILVITPHGMVLDDMFTVCLFSHASGSLDGENGGITGCYTIDTELSDYLWKELQSYGVPAASLVPDAGEEETQHMPLDWGALIPLWYCTRDCVVMPSIVLVTPCPSLTLQQHMDFGAAAARAAHTLGRRMAVIASSDWAHRHEESGPYGFHPAAAELDRRVVKAVKSNSLHELEELDEDLISDAAIDGLWPTTMLRGALAYEITHGTHFEHEFLHYDHPTYFGMLAATWKRSKQVAAQ